ncbi:SOS cell division inhibitor [Marinobacter salinisoli]|uniref:SOS cell division inhibitor n=1 Tax=Marinobacter salinisoli TaxID=2769486 RepID=A0ABX7MQI7_9GAMM|nr:SOS cell division inhibitor [Marinobacter salinisoli]QSP94414.1 SOS cell division inhibitor [Marinobacter salinisoli]
MSSPNDLLDTVDRLMSDLSRALGEEDWNRLGELNADIKPSVDPMMAAMESGALDVAAVKLRLEELQQLIGAIDQGARRARQEAQDALKEVNRNRDVASAYQNISSSGPE